MQTREGNFSTEGTEKNRKIHHIAFAPIAVILRRMCGVLARHLDANLHQLRIIRFICDNYILLCLINLDSRVRGNDGLWINGILFASFQVLCVFRGCSCAAFSVPNVL
jgi:hypothetical protein